MRGGTRRVGDIVPWFVNADFADSLELLLGMSGVVGGERSYLWIDGHNGEDGWMMMMMTIVGSRLSFIEVQPLYKYLNTCLLWDPSSRK